MNWYRIKIDEGKTEPYTFLGSSPDSPEKMVEKAARGEYIVLSDLMYRHGDDIKKWSEYDKDIVPTVYINPRTIIAIMQLKADPRTTPDK